MVYTITSKNVESDQGTDQAVDRGCVWKQHLLSFMVSFPFFTQGVQTITLSTSAHSGHFTTPETVPWSATALIISAALSAPFYGYIIDKWGRKFGFYVVIMLQGLSSGGLFTVLPIYIREICADHIRASMVALMLAMTSAGYLIKLAMMAETLMYIMVGLVMFQFLAVFLAIESPSFLVMRNKIEMATTNLAKLKCVTDDNIIVVNEISKLKAESERAKANGNLNILRILKNKIYRDAMKIGVLLYTVTILSGSIIFLDQGKTLQQLKTEADPNKLLVPIALSLGGFAAVVLLRFMERKYYLTMAYSVMVLSMGTLAVYTQTDLTVTKFRWVPMVCLAILVFSYGMAWGVPAVVMVEILNIEIRATVLASLYTYSQLLKLAHIHSFNFLKENIGIYTLFYIFTFINLIGAVYTISKVPDIKLKTVRQIERQLKRVPMLIL